LGPGEKRGDAYEAHARSKYLEDSQVERPTCPRDTLYPRKRLREGNGGSASSTKGTACNEGSSWRDYLFKAFQKGRTPPSCKPIAAPRKTWLLGEEKAPGRTRPSVSLGGSHNRRGFGPAWDPTSIKGKRVKKLTRPNDASEERNIEGMIPPEAPLDGGLVLQGEKKSIQPVADHVPYACTTCWREAVIRRTGWDKTE